MSMYKQFQNNSDLEKNGVYINYGDFRVLVARAGGANKDFDRVLAAKSKPHRRLIQTETISRELADQLEREVYAESVIRDWEVKDEEGGWQRGIESPDGNILPVTVENIVQTLENLPDLFADLKNQAHRITLFREECLEADVKNY